MNEHTNDYNPADHGVCETCDFTIDACTCDAEIDALRNEQLIADAMRMLDLVETLMEQGE